MTTRHTTHTTCLMPASQADAIHADLTADVAPQCDRHFRTAPTHTVDGTDYVLIRWPVRESVAAALVDLADTYDLSIVATPTPYADVSFPPLPDTPEIGRVYDDGGTAVLVRASGRRKLRPKSVGADWRLDEAVEEGDTI